VLKCLADTICDYCCELSQSAPDWTTELDRCEEREPSAATIFNFMKRTPTREYGSAHMMAYKESFHEFNGIDFDL